MTINGIHTTTRGGQICFQIVVLYGCNFAISYDTNTLRMNSSYTTFCGQMKRVLCERVCSAATTVTFGHGITLMLSKNVGIKSASASVFGLATSGTSSWAPICSPDRLTAQRCCDFLGSVLPGLLEYVPLAMRQMLWFQHDEAPAHYGEDVRR
jgi:hypothetical protein